MGGVATPVLQQVNLYRERTAAAPSAGARLLLFAGLGALTTVLLLAAAGQVYISTLSNARADAAATLQRHEAELAQLKERLAGIKVDPFLEAELGRLREARVRLENNLTAITRHDSAAGNGFSAVFGSLARNTLDGLWFNNVGVSAGGAEMLLKGRAIEPALVPRLLQTLAAEQAFAGRTFRKVWFERQQRESDSFVEFELRSAQSEDPDDAS